MKGRDIVEVIGDQVIERKSDDGGEQPDCPDCGGTWNPLWPPAIQRRHRSGCAWAREMTG